MVRIRLFGRVELYEGDRALPPFPTQKARALFAFLALNRGNFFSRDVLAGTFWGDTPDALARKNLRTELSRIRGVLGAGSAASELRVEGQDLCFDPEQRCWVDVHEFSRRHAALAGTAERLSGKEVGVLQEMVQLYRADLLTGVYEAWCDFDREQLRLYYVGALERLVRHYEAQREWALAIDAARAVLRCEPLREHVHRDLMRFHQALGDRAAAMRQYKDCAALLRRELDIEPMEATRALRDAIMRDGGKAGGAEPPTMRPIVAALDEAADRLRYAREALAAGGRAPAPSAAWSEPRPPA